MNKKISLFMLFTLCFLFFPLYSDDFQAIQLKGILITIDIDIPFLILIIGISIIIVFIVIILLLLIKVLNDRRKEEMSLKDLTIDERRKHLRDFTPINVMVKQQLPDGGYKIMSFNNRNISRGGVFIITENLALFELGEELEIIIKDESNNYFEGKALVIHSEAIFNKDSVNTESGYGVMFLKAYQS